LKSGFFLQNPESQTMPENEEAIPAAEAQQDAPKFTEG
jgi:hypothetical protein